MRFLNLISRLLSWVFHPLIVPSYLFYFLNEISGGPLRSGLPSDWLFLMMLILTGIAPALNLLMLKLLGLITSLHLRRREERFIPGMMTTALYTMEAWMVWSKWPNSGIVNGLILMCIVAAAGTALSLWKKVSIHAMSMTSATTILLWYGLTVNLSPADPPVAAIVLSGMVMSGRLILGAHTSEEVALGGTGGVAASLAGLWLIQP